MESKFPNPPYYAVIFTSELSDDIDGYSEMGDKMLQLASKQKGFLGIDSARDKLGITISYWRNLDSIKQWKQNMDHKIAQKLGKDRWYKSYTTRISKVEQEYSFNK